jgi:phage terminase large subunit
MEQSRRLYELPPKLEAIRTKPARYKVLYGGRGSGKSWSVARILLDFGTKAKLRILCAREIQRTIAESVHQLLRDQIAALGLESFYTVTETTIVGKNGTQFLFAGLRQQDVAKIKSFEGVDIVWVEEAQVVTKKSWEILGPTIRKTPSEIWITFNPELDTDETYQRFVARPPEDSIVLKLNYADNEWFPAVLEQERVALRERDPESYDNVWEGNCRSAVEGAIYAKEIRTALEQRRIRPVPHDPLLRTHAIWDLGWNDAMSIIIAQRSSSEIRVIDYIEDSHRTYDSYVHELRNRPYRWGKDFLPHDGKAKNAQTGMSPIEVLKKLGRDVQETPDIGVEEGIKAARQVFGRVFFDETTTTRLVHCLKRYRRAINQTTNEPGAPMHDEFSHGADAFRYLAVVAEQMQNEDSGWSGDIYAGFRRAG